MKRIKALQSQNQSLTNQLKRLQGLLARSTAKTVQPATCLMVLLLSMALVMAPNMKLNKNNILGSNDQSDETSVSESEEVPVKGEKFL